MQNKIYKPELSNVSSKSIGHGCTIHSHVWIGKDVKIGNKVKIQAFSFIPDGVVIEDNVFIGPHVVFTNDRKPPSDTWSKILVKKGARIGANASILAGVTIGEGALIGMGSVVIKDVKPYTTVVGNPAHDLSR